jgi:hypothetical protein
MSGNNPIEPGDDLPREVTPGGSEVIRHEGSSGGDGPDCTYLDETEMDAIQEHVRAHIGEFDEVMHEIISEGVHLDLLAVHVPEEDDEPITFITTMGMSAVPMNMPEMALEEGEDESDLPSPFAELFMLLPGLWPKDAESLEVQDHWWPYRVLKECGRVPALFDTFLGPGHTIPNGDPPEPYAPNCPFTGVLILPGMFLEEEFATLQIGEKRVEFLMVVPLYTEEMTHKLEHGVESLIELFEKAEIAPHQLADPARPNLCA